MVSLNIPFWFGFSLLHFPGDLLSVKTSQFWAVLWMQFT